jgi:hypothetical protein
LEQVGFTAILLGQFLVWLPNRAAGLTLMGLELAEWLKFLPEAQSGAIGPVQIFYLPPATLALLMLLTTAQWPRRGATLAMRILALVVGLLALPPLEVLVGGVRGWLPSAALVALVGGVFLLAQLGWLRRLSARVIWSVMLLLAAVGGVWPTLAYDPARALVSNLVGEPLGTGPGVWFNLLGHALVAAAVGWRWRSALH